MARKNFVNMATEEQIESLKQRVTARLKFLHDNADNYIDEWFRSNIKRIIFAALGIRLGSFNDVEFVSDEKKSFFVRKIKEAVREEEFDRQVTEVLKGVLDEIKHTALPGEKKLAAAIRKEFQRQVADMVDYRIERAVRKRIHLRVGRLCDALEEEYANKCHAAPWVQYQNEVDSLIGGVEGEE